ncbi:CRTAC1 family protein [Gracilimonas sp. BCB1]
MNLINRFLLTVIIGFTSCTANNYEQAEWQFTKIDSDFTAQRASTGGISLIDIDGDYDLDVYVSNGYDVSSGDPQPQKNRLYINDGDGNLKPEESSILSNDEMFSSGSAWADVNNDGLVDVFIANQRSQDNALFLNMGNGDFKQVENSVVGNDGGHSYSANWSDIDNDGDLDLYVANGGISHQQADFLYENNGDETFTKVQNTPITRDTLSTVGGLWRDFNGDNLPDLYASYRLQKDRIYFNNGGWEFDEYTLDAPGTERYSFPKSAGTAGDVDNDGDIDIYQTSMMGGANFLFINNGKGEFEFMESGRLTSAGGHTYGALITDFDNDGLPDVVAANWGSSVNLFRNQDGRFVPESNTAFSERVFYASTIITGDIDGDGKQDILIPQWPNTKGDYERNEWYQNSAKKTGNWLKIKLRGTQSNSSGIGAKIEVTCEEGSEIVNQTRIVSSQQTWRSQGGLIQQIGLGNCSAVKEVLVRWPSARESIMDEIPVNQLLEITEPD